MAEDDPWRDVPRWSYADDDRPGSSATGPDAPPAPAVPDGVPSDVGTQPPPPAYRRSALPPPLRELAARPPEIRQPGFRPPPSAAPFPPAVWPGYPAPPYPPTPPQAASLPPPYPPGRYPPPPAPLAPGGAAGWASGKPYGAASYPGFGYGPSVYLPRPAAPGPTPWLSWGSYRRRFAAFLLDLGIFFALFIAVSIVIAQLTNAATGELSEEATLVAVIYGISLVTYWPILWVLAGATLGERALSLQVRRADGRTVDPGTALVRYAGCWLTMLAFIATPVAIAFLVATLPDEPRRRMWHDRMAATVVVRTL